MSVEAATTRPPRKSAGAAGVGVLVTLVVFVVTFLVFLVAPLLALAIGLLVYTVLRARSSEAPARAGSGAQPAAGDFGAGAR